jgi:putative two-component system response regulator
MQVIIVDDNPLNLRLMQGLVDKVGEFSTLTFQDPMQGLRWCETNVPDLLIVDYMMPELNGLDFIRQFRDLAGYDDIPVLMITADHERQTRYDALENGANDFLTKPIDAPEFKARVHNMINLRRSQKRLANYAADLERDVTLATAEIRAKQEQILDREREMIMRLAKAAEFRDPETGAHILRMAHYSRLIAEELGLPEQEQDLILRAAPMHDMGKIAIPDHILLKPGRLEDEELAIMRRHAEFGYEILRGSASTLLDVAATIAWSHHEKFDGSGYPRGLMGEEIPLHGRIVAVADVFDALTTERPYKPAWELSRAIGFLNEFAGSHFDPDCVRAFLARLDDALAIQARYQDHVPTLAHL